MFNFNLAHSAALNTGLIIEEVQKTNNFNRLTNTYTNHVYQLFTLPLLRAKIGKEMRREQNTV